jgi:hypothetical protein
MRRLPASPRYLRTEYQIDPLGLDETEPRFSWLISDERRGACESAYRVVVASSAEKLAAGEGDLWDSGKVASHVTAHVAYARAPLRAFSRATWKARVWGSDGQPSPWSEPARFELGPLTTYDWTLGIEGIDGWRSAPFIRSAMVGDAQTSHPAPFMLGSFRVDGAVAQARRLQPLPVAHPRPDRLPRRHPRHRPSPRRLPPRHLQVTHRRHRHPLGRGLTPKRTAHSIPRAAPGGGARTNHPRWIDYRRLRR